MAYPKVFYGYFIVGLHDEIWLDVKIKQPHVLVDTISVARMIEKRISLSQCTSHFSLPPILVTQQPTPNNFSRILGRPTKVDQIVHVIAPPLIQVLSNQEAHLIIKKGCVIIVKRNLILTTVVKSRSYSWLKILCYSHNSILVKTIGAVVEDANRWRFLKTCLDFDLVDKVVLSGGEWYMLNIYGDYAHSLQAKVEDLFKLVRILLVGVG